MSIHNIFQSYRATKTRSEITTPVFSQVQGLDFSAMAGIRTVVCCRLRKLKISMLLILIKKNYHKKSRIKLLSFSLRYFLESPHKNLKKTMTKNQLCEARPQILPLRPIIHKKINVPKFTFIFCSKKFIVRGLAIKYVIKQTIYYKPSRP